MSAGPHPFTLRQLQYVVAIADELSFRKAAERCHVSQPTLSAQVAEMESALGATLFERDRRGVLLTGPAAELVSRARTILREADDLVELARRTADPFSGSLRIGVIPTVSAYLLPCISPALRHAYPGLSVSWLEDKTDALVRLLASGTLDAAVLAMEADVGDLEHEVLAFDPFLLATPRDHPLGVGAGPLTLADLRGANVLLLDDGHCLRDQALALCSRARVRELEFRATSLSTLVQMVASGAGVTLLPRLAADTERRRSEIRLRPFAEPCPGRTIALVWRRRSPLNSALRQLAMTARASCANDGKIGGAFSLSQKTHAPALPSRGSPRVGRRKR
jgi:LysR family hydrogen peroxide-inducible transcriptional activator